MCGRARAGVSALCKIAFESGVVAHAFDLSTREAEVGCAFEVSLVYIASSRPARAA